MLAIDLLLHTASHRWQEFDEQHGTLQAEEPLTQESGKDSTAAPHIHTLVLHRAPVAGKDLMNLMAHCRLKSHSLKGGARAVLLAPTRELALQTHRVVKELGRYTDLRTAVLVGGDSMEAQFAELAANPDIIVATPG